MKINLDIVSDSVCPWCWIGKRKFEAAAKARPELEFDISWRPFQLNPDMPLEGRDHKEYYREKFGKDQSLAIMERMTAAGEEEGIGFHFDKVARSPNTLASHRLIRWAKTAGVQDAVVEALFSAYFGEGRDIGDQEVLIEIGTSAGMDADILRTLYGEGRDEAEVKEEADVPRLKGISGVPFFVFNEKYSMSGAQPAHMFNRVFDLIVEKEG